MPCSRGEEPYSLAMTLLDAGLSPTQFEIVACDLSPRSLEYARRGRYRSIAFRESDPVSQRLVRQHFQLQGDEWLLGAEVRERVKFQPANLALPDSLAGLGKFDFIFCRNVLIYLTSDVRQAAMSTFKRILNPGGILYLGHSECRLGPQAGAVAWKDEFPAAFVWNSAANQSLQFPTVDARLFNVEGSAKLKPSLIAPQSNRIASSVMPNATDAAAKAAVKPTVKPGLNPAANAAANTPGNMAGVTNAHADNDLRRDLQRARELANAGKLNEAESICQSILGQRPTSADVYCLLGVIVQARGDLVQAESHFQRSLFLQPNHHESLTHVLLLAERRGDHKGVANYQRRLNRLRNQGT